MGKLDQMGNVKILLAVVWRMPGGWENRRVEEGTSEEGRNDGQLQEGKAVAEEELRAMDSLGRFCNRRPSARVLGLREEARKKFRCVAWVPGRNGKAVLVVGGAVSRDTFVLSGLRGPVFRTQGVLRG